MVLDKWLISVNGLENRVLMEIVWFHIVGHIVVMVKLWVGHVVFLVLHVWVLLNNMVGWVVGVRVPVLTVDLSVVLNGVWVEEGVVSRVGMTNSMFWGKVSVVSSGMDWSLMVDWCVGCLVCWGLVVDWSMNWGVVDWCVGCLVDWSLGVGSVSKMIGRDSVSVLMAIVVWGHVTMMVVSFDGMSIGVVWGGVHWNRGVVAGVPVGGVHHIAVVVGVVVIVMVHWLHLQDQVAARCVDI